jgi:hypothetical protein
MGDTEWQDPEGLLAVLESCQRPTRRPYLMDPGAKQSTAISLFRSGHNNHGWPQRSIRV